MSEVPTYTIPESWAWRRIQDVATTATGGTPSRTVKEYFGGSIPWVKSGELGDGHVYETEETLSELGLASSNAKLFPNGTLCIALYGATVGKLGILEVDAATNQAVCGIFLPPTINRDFVFHYLASIRHRLIEQGKGGAQSNISNGLVRQTWIPIAPENEQRRIVAKIEELFSDLDAGVAALMRAKANLKRYRASVLKAAVEGHLTAAWRAEHLGTEPASALLARILTQRRQKWEADQLAKFTAAGKSPPKNWKDKYPEPSPPDTTNLPELPQGWCWTTLEAIANLVGGVTKDQKKANRAGMREVPYLRVANVQRGYLDLSEMKSISASNEDISDLRLEVGDVLFTEGGDRDKLGRGWVWSAELPECIHQNHVFRGRLFSQEIQPRLVSHHGNTFGKEWFIKAGKQTTNLASINLGILKRFPVPIPPSSEQSVIIALVDEKLSQIDAAAAQVEHGLLRAARLRQSILKQAFEGKLVPQDPADEPASGLLARLQPTEADKRGAGSQTSPRRAKIRK
jgi:type I restriction enzyme S subunit